MKFLVDQLPNRCNECRFCADAMVRSQLGVQKPVNVCLLWMTLMPPTVPNQEPHFIIPEKTPKENDCLCAPAMVVDDTYGATDNYVPPQKSNLII